MSAILYQKTELGLREIAERSGQLGQKERRLLIMIDGQRDSTMLGALLPGEDVGTMLARLRQLGFINACASQVKQDVLSFSGPTTIAPPLPRDNSKQLAAASKVILDVTSQYLGQNWEDKLAAQLQGVRDADDLAPIIEQWLNALRRSGHRGAADTGQRQVNALLSPVS
ncbi:hypothetical protein [Chitinilyticum litopenaei]|uniref:hypothetical protein n=1 Tax=Chitinilyticum litopenaei TaxID=1121276 RepID=UPI00048FAAB5|nr:hypothetical protein [Chitinilyticum litopenaei]